MWTKQGVLIYERKLEEPLMQWNLIGKMLLFRQHKSNGIINCLKLREKRRCTLFKLDISAKILCYIKDKRTAPDFDNYQTGDSTLGYAEGHLFAAHENHVYYVNVKRRLKEIEAQSK